MIIAVGSTNKAKILAVQEVIQEIPLLREATVIALSASSDVSEQPLSFEETAEGAKNRARNAFNKCDSCDYSFGIESGLMEAPGTSTGYLNVQVCSIYNGINYYIGLSCGFEVPKTILERILEHKMDLTEACLQSGITTNSNIGSTEGLIGVLTKGKIDRKEYSKQSIITAVAQLDNSDWY